MRRPPSILLALCALVLAAPAAGAKPARSWAEAEIKLVTSRGLMGANAAAFRPDATITRGEVADLVAGLTAQQKSTVAARSAPVTMTELNTRLVNGLGLAPQAAQFARTAKAAGLAPPGRFGSEVVARLLGLRKNHPAAQDALERLPTDAATRAEAAYSAARVLRFGGWEAQSVQAAATTFALPPLTAWQARILRTAFRFVGYPYVWGGTSELPQTLFGVSSRGGFDCSGFVWRVYKLEAYPGAASLAQTLRGRTTFAMSAETAPAKRIPFAKLAPGDLVFFGSKGPRSKPAEIGHMGIYAGNGWLVHSSRNGVAVEPLAGWYRSSFAWGRRPLAEAGLAPIF